MAARLARAEAVSRSTGNSQLIAAIRTCLPGISVSVFALLLRKLLSHLGARLLRRLQPSLRLGTIEPSASGCSEAMATNAGAECHSATVAGSEAKSCSSAGGIDPIWASCSLTAEQVQRFGRQIVLPKLGVAGQQALLQSRVLIIGAGGLGCPVALYLCAAGIGHLGIVDGDVVDVSNLHRQVGHSWKNVGENKAVSLRRACLAINNTSEVTAYPKSVATLAEAEELAAAYDILVDCTDLPASRYRVNDAAVLAGKPLVAASSVGLSGQLAVYNIESGPCLRCVFPDAPGEHSAEPVASCAENGVLGPVPGILGCLAALETIKVLAGGSLRASRLCGQMLLYDALDSGQPFRTMRIRKKETCLCSQAGLTALRNLHALELKSNPKATAGGCRCPAAAPTGPCPSITPAELHKRLHSGQDVVIIDVRPRSHFAVSHLAQSENWPLPELIRAPAERMRDRVEQLAPEREHSKGEPEPHEEVTGEQRWVMVGGEAMQESNPMIVCVCRRGNDSARATNRLREAAIKAFNLDGGLVALAALAEAPLQPPPLT